VREFGTRVALPRTKSPPKIDYATLREAAERSRSSRCQELDRIVEQLSGWYALLAKTSNEVFIVEHHMRPKP